MSKLRLIVMALVALVATACVDRYETEEAKAADSPLAPSFIVNSEAPQKSSVCVAYETELASLQERGDASAEQVDGMTALVQDVCN